MDKIVTVPLMAIAIAYKGCSKSWRIDGFFDSVFTFFQRKSSILK